MKRTWIVFSLTALVAACALAAAEPALAAPKKAKRACADRPYQFSWNFLQFGGSKPQANGCAPAVYVGGDYIGQDPDANIRMQLMRDPATGYPMNYQ